MVKHHPPIEFLTEYASGALPIAQAACVSAHLSYCHRCHQQVDSLEGLGGVMLERLAPEVVSESVLETVLARLDEPVPLQYGKSVDDGGLPSLLRRIINGDYSQLTWKRLTSSLSISYLKSGDTDYEFALDRIASGGAIPHHDHRGSEMTLVLHGGFSDERGEYHPGDFVYRTADEEHAPRAIPGEDCVCLAVLDAPLRFTRWRHRWINPFLQLRAG
jgi:putative transcriptional regulator